MEWEILLSVGDGSLETSGNLDLFSVGEGVSGVVGEDTPLTCGLGIPVLAGIFDSGCVDRGPNPGILLF